MDYKDFFIKNNKSGWKTKENILKIKEPKIYYEIINFSEENNFNDLPFKEKIWYFIHNEKTKKKCLSCGDFVKFKDSLSKGYNDFCSLECANKSGLLNDRIVKTNKEKYGVSYFPEHNTFISKVKKTKHKKYGNENYNNIEKCIRTKELLYGDKFFSNKEKSKTTLRNNFISKVKEKTNDEFISYGLDDEKIKLKCSKCQSVYEIDNNLFNYRTNVNISTCIICNPINSTDSFQEKELLEFVKNLLPNQEIIEKDRNLISPFELDILIPTQKIAIEYNGLYWHSDKYVEKDYHLTKTNLCNSKGIQLIHIFEDEWIYKKEIVKSIIKTKLNLFESTIFGRNCVIKEIDVKTSKQFLNNNHIQGYVNAKYSFGLFHNNELVSVMTFGGLRKALGSENLENEYELYRFANKLNTNVIGAFSKLLKFFVKEYKPKSIISFSNNRYFNGNVYQKNGFEFVSETKPNYYYIVKHKREDRFKYRKNILVKEGFDAKKSEKEIMTERGINRIYDCGNKKWKFLVN